MTFTLASCESFTEDPAGAVVEPNTFSFDEARVASKLLNSNAFNLYKEKDSEVNGNFSISPYSLYQVLAMYANGAEGETLAELRQAMGFGNIRDLDINFSLAQINWYSKNDENVVLNNANSIWGDNNSNVNKPFLDANQYWFGAEYKHTQDLTSGETKSAFNKWCEKATNGIITNYLNYDIVPTTKLLLANVLYFKGQWSMPFDKGRTKTEDFTCEDGTISQVEMMNHSGVFSCYSNDDYRIAEFEYEGGMYSMSIILPRKGRTIDRCMNVIDASVWERLESDEGKHPSQLNVKMPKMKLMYSGSNLNVLKKLGLSKALDSEQAEFKGITNDSFAITDIRQATYIEVDESGTTAAAVSSTGSTSVSDIDNDDPEFYINRPFVYVIQNRQLGTILFIGKVTNL